MATRKYHRGHEPAHGDTSEGLQDNGSEYSAEEAEFIQAMEQWMRESHVKFPSFTDILKVAKALGYRRADVVAEPDYERTSRKELHKADELAHDAQRHRELYHERKKRQQEPPSQESPQ